MSVKIEIENSNTLLSVLEVRKRKSLANLLLTYFKYAYYWGLSPFRIEAINGIPVTVTWWLPKLVWAIVLVPCVLFRIAETLDALHDSDRQWNPSAYFSVFHAIAKLFFHGVFWYYLGFRSDRYLQIVIFIYESANLPVPQIRHFRWKILAPFISILFLILGIFLGTTFVGRFLDCNKHYEIEDIKRMFWFCVTWGKYLLFMEHGRVRCDTLTYVANSLTTSDIVVGVVTGVATLLRHVNGFYEELFIPTGVFIFWLCSKEFESRLQRLSTLYKSQDYATIWEPALAWYSSLKEFSDLIRDAYGDILLQRLILMIFDVPLSFEFKNGDRVNQLRFVVLFMINVLLYICAADASKRVKTFETWISYTVDRRAPGISSQKLSVLLHELQSNTVGISTSVGFTISYSFVANVTGILITYFIICVPNNETHS